MARDRNVPKLFRGVVFAHAPHNGVFKISRMRLARCAFRYGLVSKTHPGRDRPYLVKVSME
jgi:hypothetical protein